MSFKKLNGISRLLIIFAFAICILSVSSAYAGKIMIPAGTEIKVRFDPNMEITSKTTSEGIPLLINLAEPIDIGGVTVVEKGAAGTANVVEVKKKGMVGKAGYIKIQFVDLEAKGDFMTPEGEKIKLSGFAEGKGKGKKLISILLGFGLIIKGGDGKIATNEFYPATVAENIILESE